MKKLHEALEEKIKKAEKLPKQLATGIPEAPVDGNEYIRINGDWAKISGVRGVTVYHQINEPTDQQDGDIWIIRKSI